MTDQKQQQQFWNLEVISKSVISVFFEEDVTFDEARERLMKDEYDDIVDEYGNEVLEVTGGS